MFTCGKISEPSSFMTPDASSLFCIKACRPVIAAVRIAAAVLEHKSYVINIHFSLDNFLLPKLHEKTCQHEANAYVRCRMISFNIAENL